MLLQNGLTGAESVDNFKTRLDSYNLCGKTLCLVSTTDSNSGDQKFYGMVGIKYQRASRNQ